VGLRKKATHKGRKKRRGFNVGSVYIPAPSCHATGQGYVRWKGKTLYFGRFESCEKAWREWADDIAKQAVGIAPTRLILGTAASDSGSVHSAVVAFLRHAKEYYRGNNEFEMLKGVGAMIVEPFGHLPIEQFGAVQLKAVRQAMIGRGWCRKTINSRVGKLRRMFRWGVSEGIVPETVFGSLAALAPLMAGRCGTVPESKRKEPVLRSTIDATLPYLSSVVTDMVELQWLVGMRPTELCELRTCDIDRSADPWAYRPRHKNQWRGQSLVYYFGQQSQAILSRRMDPKHPDRPLFQPETAAREYVAQSRKQKAGEPLTIRRMFRASYNKSSYRKAIVSAVRQANKARLEQAEWQGIAADQVELVPHWHPHLLRHSKATALRSSHGIEAARAALGHASFDSTEIYAERDDALARRVATETG
jgi:integrase